MNGKYKVCTYFYFNRSTDFMFLGLLIVVVFYDSARMFVFFKYIPYFFADARTERPYNKL